MDWINGALTGPLLRRMRRRSWEGAIDWHWQPYYGQPEKSHNELYYGRLKQGATRFHAYCRDRNRKDGKQRRPKPLFAAWRVQGSPTDIRDRYRLRFGSDTNFRRMRQARIYI